MNHDSNKPNTAGIKIGLPNSSNKGFDVKTGMIDSNPNAPYNPNNNIKLYDSKDNTKRVAIACIVDCPFEIINNQDSIMFENNNTKSPISITTSQSNSIQPFTYQDSNITAKEIINDNNASTLIIDSKNNPFEYQGNTADTLMSGISAMFASMAELAKQLDSIKKDSARIFGAKGRIAYWIFQTEGASVSLTYNYGNNGKDMTKAVVSVGIEILAGIAATAFMPTSAPVLVFVSIATIASVGISLFLNTQIGKNTNDWIVDKLQSFFSMFDSNPLEYELVPNPTLSSKDYQSLIELLLNKNSNALDIDNLLHTFPNYLQTQNNTNSHDHEDSPSQESFLPPDTINSHRVGEIHFSIQILDEYTRMPITNAKLQLQNVNLGQESITNAQGLATFMIKESEYLKPFMAKLIHNNYQECPIFDRSIIPNAYRSAKKPLELRFLGKIHCYFNGKELILRNVTKTDIF